MSFNFAKMHGIGNDFVIFDDRSGIIENEYKISDLARNICDRKFGVGADGIILIQSSHDHDFKFRIFNSDGSSAQMCGNGMRCVAKYIYEKNWISKKKLRMDTLAGTVIPEVVLNAQGKVESVRVDMGAPMLECRLIPFCSNNEQAVEMPILAGENHYAITAVSMGNPHAVLFVDNLDKFDIETVGPLIENHEWFPEKTNVEFVQILNRAELRMRVWERGAGITLACGTGACAALVAADLTGRTSDKVLIHLDGGDLEIKWDKESNHLFKQGPAQLVFEGVFYMS